MKIIQPHQNMFKNFVNRYVNSGVLYVATIVMFAFCEDASRAQVPVGDPQLFKTVNSDKELDEWHPEFSTLAQFTAVVSASKPMSTSVVGDFYFGWRVDTNPKNETLFTWCYYLRKPSTKKPWSFGISLYFVDASGKRIQRVSEAVNDEVVKLRVLRAVFHSSPTSFSTSDEAIMGDRRVLQAIPSGATALLCIMGGRKEGLRSYSEQIIPVAQLAAPSSPNH